MFSRGQAGAWRARLPSIIFSPPALFFKADLCVWSPVVDGKLYRHAWINVPAVGGAVLELRPCVAGGNHNIINGAAAAEARGFERHGASANVALSG